MLYVKVAEFMHHIETEYQALVDDTGLSLVEIHVMRVLFERNGQHPSELARSVGRAATAFTPILDRIEGKGFVKRKEDPDDRRAIRVYLTEIGESQRNNITQYAEEADETLESELGVYLPVELLTEHAPGVGQLVGEHQPTDVKEWLSLS